MSDEPLNRLRPKLGEFYSGLPEDEQEVLRGIVALAVHAEGETDEVAGFDPMRDDIALKQRVRAAQAMLEDASIQQNTPGFDSLLGAFRWPAS